MAGVTVCTICERVIKANQSAIECSGCLTWVHKGCTKLSNIEFDKIFTMGKKKKSHKWKCINCKPNEVKRLSVEPNYDYNTDEGTPTLEQQEEYVYKFSDDNRKGNVPSSGMIATPINKIKMGMDDIVKKGNVNNKEIILIMSQIITLLVEQNKNIQEIILETKVMKNDKIGKLEKEIDDLKQKLSNTRPVTDIVDTLRPNSQLPIDTFIELQERSERSKNLIVHNIEESKSADLNERIEHDKTQVRAILEKLGRGTITNFKVIRIGRKVQKARPIKLLLPDQATALECLKQKKKLQGSNISITADRTALQRAHLKELYAELEHRKKDGESDLIISYHKGHPQISKINNRVNNKHNSTVPKN